jgi:chemotaxis protein methyltransferase CheR
MMKDASFRYLADFLKRHSGLIVDGGKRYLLETRLTPLLKQHDLGNLDALVDRLQRDEQADIAVDTIQAMTTNETLFFRDNYPFEVLQQLILPEISRTLPVHEKIHIWSAACSKGQEPYSIAMTAVKSVPNVNRRVRITASDIDRKVLLQAEEGVYTQMEVQRGLPVQMLVRYFEQHQEHWRVRDELRSLVRFRHANLISNNLSFDLRPDGAFHIVFCRNVLIYFSPEERARVIDRIASTMAPRGYLITGAAENVSGAASQWDAVSFNGRRLWQLKSI